MGPIINILQGLWDQNLWDSGMNYWTLEPTLGPIINQTISASLNSFQPWSMFIKLNECIFIIYKGWICTFEIIPNFTFYTIAHSTIHQPFRSRNASISHLELSYWLFRSRNWYHFFGSIISVRIDILKNVIDNVHALPLLNVSTLWEFVLQIYGKKMSVEIEIEKPG